MTEREDRHERFAAMLDVYGADPDRWPPHLFREFAPWLDEPSMAATLAGAAALDRLLTEVPRDAEVARMALRQRILAKSRSRDVLENPAVETTDVRVGTIIAFEHERDRGREGSRPQRVRPLTTDGPHWPVAALMAACLCLGIFAGLGASSLQQDDGVTVASVGLLDDFEDAPPVGTTDDDGMFGEDQI
ncbi:MAG: hypothetical protein NW205_10785 [Hyphomicrobiaceae bacterium]|nr:hypothetical protein [Hyphomicrobiaceae bacterium]